MLGLGVPWAWAALVAISATHHGWPENVANCVVEYCTARVQEVYVGIVQTLSNQYGILVAHAPGVAVNLPPIKRW